MTDGTIAVLSYVAMVIMILAEVADAYMTTKGLDAGDVEVGVINRLFIKSKADEGKLALIAFLEGVGSLGVCMAAFIAGGPAYGLAAATGLAAAEIANDVRSFLLLKKQHVL